MPQRKRVIDEFLKFIHEIGFCRQCNRPLAVKEKRNLLLVYFPDYDNLTDYHKLVTLVNKSAFRCSFCHTRHQFIPFHENNLEYAYQFLG